MKHFTQTQLTEITEILNAGQFDYEYCGRTPSASTMADYLSDLDAGHFTEKEVGFQLAQSENEITDLYTEQSKEGESLNDFAARFIADSVAQVHVKCIYEGVIFTF